MSQPDLVGALDVLELQDGQVLCEPGDPSTGAWLLLAGTLSLESHVSERRGSCVRRRDLQVGEWVGVVSMLDGGPCLQRVAAAGPARVAVLPRAVLQRLLAVGDPQAVAMLTQWLTARARALDHLNRENVRMLRLAAEL